MPTPRLGATRCVASHCICLFEYERPQAACRRLVHVPTYRTPPLAPRPCPPTHSPTHATHTCHCMRARFSLWPKLFECVVYDRYIHVLRLVLAAQRREHAVVLLRFDALVRSPITHYDIRWSDRVNFDCRHRDTRTLWLLRKHVDTPTDIRSVIAGDLVQMQGSHTQGRPQGPHCVCALQLPARVACSVVSPGSNPPVQVRRADGRRSRRVRQRPRPRHRQ